MRAAFEEHDIVAEHGEHASKDRRREAAPDNGHLADVIHRVLHASQAIRGSA